MHHLYLAPDGSWRPVRAVGRCGLRNRPADPWSPGVVVRDGAVLRAVRAEQLIRGRS